MKNTVITRGCLVASVLLTVPLMSCVYSTKLEYAQPQANGGVTKAMSVRVVEHGSKTHETITNGIDLQIGKVRLQITAESTVVAAFGLSGKEAKVLQIAVAVSGAEVEIDPYGFIAVADGKEHMPIKVQRRDGEFLLAFDLWPWNFVLHIRGVIMDGKPLAVPPIQFKHQAVWNWGMAP